MKNRLAEIDITPSARRLTGSLRDIGYDFVSAIADLVDNSISASARQVDIEFCFEGENSYVLIADDGVGMSDGFLTEALRFGTRRSYDEDELGRYGLGLKTASLSQCRRVTVATRQTPIQRRISFRTLDLDHIVKTDRWELVDPPIDTFAFRALEWLNHVPGTVVLWEHLDRVLAEVSASGGWARRRMEALATRTAAHLGMVFHRFIEGSVHRPSLTITLNGEKVKPWNPFAPDEPMLVVLDERRYEVVHRTATGTVTLRRYVLPPRELFSSHGEFEHLSGPAKWNRQQGLYVYRGDRLIQSGGWNGIRAIDEHTKLARASLDFSPELDEAFHINVAKMRLLMPSDVRTLIEPHVTELCHRAEEMYRRETRVADTGQGKGEDSNPGDVSVHGLDLTEVGATVLSAALATGQTAAFSQIVDHVKTVNADVALALGW